LDSQEVTSRPQQPPAGSFRSRITIVPLDVRVLDRSGKLITDLKQDDFTIVEDGVTQTISHFAVQSLTADAASPAAPLPVRRDMTAPMAPQNHRVFLVVLGRGRLQEPSKNLDALIAFIRTSLLPQDHVAVLAFNRATDFTANHDLAARAVEQFRAQHEQIEADLRQYFSGLRAVYGSKEIPPYIQKEIDDMFAGVSSLRPRPVVPGQATDSSQIAADVRRTADELQRAGILADREGGIPDPAATATAERMDMDFDTYVAQQRPTMQDLGNLYAGIEYLRFIDGEKHLLYLTEYGLNLPRQDNDRSLAKIASDARVAIDILRTGGLVGPPPPNGKMSYALPTTAMMFAQTFSVQDSRLIADLTGGRATAFEPGARALRQLDDSTRFQYLLGYYPTNPATDGKFRQITVKVNRPGATVLYRHGYFASERLVPIDRRAFLTFTRVAAAGRYDRPIDDIKVTVGKPVSRDTAAGRELEVPITVQSARIGFTEADGRHLAELDVAIFCGDGRQRMVGETWQTMTLRLSDESFRRFQTEGASYTARVTINGPALYVKVIVYDYKTDLLGTATAGPKDTPRY
jgi:VWFA-related protein